MMRGTVWWRTIQFSFAGFRCFLKGANIICSRKNRHSRVYVATVFVFFTLQDKVYFHLLTGQHKYLHFSIISLNYHPFCRITICQGALGFFWGKGNIWSKGTIHCVMKQVCYVYIFINKNGKRAIQNYVTSAHHEYNTMQIVLDTRDVVRRE